MTKDYELTKVGIDPIILTIHNKKLKVFLKKREKEPYKTKLELPGGLIKIDETAENALLRKLNELLDKPDIFFEQFFTFTDPLRDPRERTISIGFIALIDHEKIESLDSWHDCKNLDDLAFDHEMIISKAREYLQKNINADMIKQFMPKEFPLNNLQEAYEIITETKYDNRNFRKKMISSGMVKETDKLETNVSHRPAKLFTLIVGSR